jgi:hypothetical protein
MSVDPSSLGGCCIYLNRTWEGIGISVLQVGVSVSHEVGNGGRRYLNGPMAMLWWACIVFSFNSFPSPSSRSHRSYESCQNHSLGPRLMEASRHSIPRTMQQNAQIVPQASILRRNSHSGLLSTSDALPLEKGCGTRLLAHIGSVTL